MKHEETKEGQNAEVTNSDRAGQPLLGDERIVSLIKYLASRILEEKQWRLEDSESGGDEVNESLDMEKWKIFENISNHLQLDKNDSKIYDSFFT